MSDPQPNAAAFSDDPSQGNGLLTDLYQLTMTQGYWKLGRADEEAVFHLYFRRAPFGGGFALAAGLEQAVGFARGLHYSPAALAWLGELRGNDGQALFEPGFLAWLGELRTTCDIDAVAEGTPCFAHAPMLRIRGPLAQCQLLETPLLTIINFQTLIATKAARIAMAAQGDPVLEFGLRRAQGVDGGLTASRAAYIGGCAATSNALAGMRYGIPVRGTHAHAWVMAFPDERQAFAGYAQAMPNNCVFLVDTYDTLAGVDKAIEQGKILREQGHEMVGVRLDSGDLAELSKGARTRLDAAGFPDAKIVASNDLDEYRITALKRDGAKIGIWGVGTRLATAYDQPALGGVYKLAALRKPGGDWRRMVKLSDTPIKNSTPGILQVRRVRVDGRAAIDVVFDEELGEPKLGEIVSGIDPEREDRPTIPADGESEDLLKPILRGGEQVWDRPDSTTQIRAYAQRELEALPDDVRALSEAARYPVGLEPRLADLRSELIESRGGTRRSTTS